VASSSTSTTRPTRRRAEEELRELAVRDGVTGLANRTLLLDRAERALVAGRRTGRRPGWSCSTSPAWRR
jgi:GGDEF domain-containing protein